MLPLRISMAEGVAICVRFAPCAIWSMGCARFVQGPVVAFGTRQGVRLPYRVVHPSNLCLTGASLDSPPSPPGPGPRTSSNGQYVNYTTATYDDRIPLLSSSVHKSSENERLVTPHSPPSHSEVTIDRKPCLIPCSIDHQHRHGPHQPPPSCATRVQTPVVITYISI